MFVPLLIPSCPKGMPVSSWETGEASTDIDQGIHDGHCDHGGLPRTVASWIVEFQFETRQHGCWSTSTRNTCCGLTSADAESCCSAHLGVTVPDKERGRDSRVAELRPDAPWRLEIPRPRSPQHPAGGAVAPHNYMRRETAAWSCQKCWVQ